MNPDAFLRQAREFEEESSNSWIGRQVLCVFMICGASVRERASEFKQEPVSWRGFGSLLFYFLLRSSALTYVISYFLSLLQLRQTNAQTLTHPLPVVRVRELDTWSRSDEYRQLISKGRPVSAPFPSR